MASHSPSSSLADVDYYGYSHSTSSSLSNASILPATTTEATSASSGRVHQKPSLARVSVPSFAQFRSRVSSIPIASPTSARGKTPFAPATPARTASLSKAQQGSPRIAPPISRPFSLDSPVQQQHPQQQPHQRQRGAGEVSPLTPEYAPRQEERQSFNFPLPPRSHTRSDSIGSRLAGTRASSSHYGDSRRSSIPVHARYAHEQTISHAPKLSIASSSLVSAYPPAQRLSTVSSMDGTQELPTMKLELEGARRTLTDESLSPSDDSRPPRSPGLRGFFGWQKMGQKSGSESPTTTFSDRSLSPFPSPNFQKPDSMEASPSGARLTPAGLDVHKLTSPPTSSGKKDYFENIETPILIGSEESNAHVKELERELTHVSTELAESIKREMELEDEIDRLKAEVPPEVARRGSDYWSDSGASSTRFPISDLDAKLEQMELKLRKSEQEKAHTKVEMASRLQAELSRRRDLEDMVKKMEEQLQAKFDEEDERGDAEERVDELESTLEDTRRLLKQERQAKANFEDLYSATREELGRHKNEHDNLRDEIVPQLRARINGLESEAADTQALVYENTRIQQELHALKTSKAHGRVSSIAEEDETTLSAPRVNSTRSAPLARNGSWRGGSLSRSASVVDRTDGTRQRSGSGSGAPLSAEAAKDLEDQRDALHKALKLMILRSEKQQREHEHAIKKLTSAKHSLEASTPGRSAYQKEVSFLKDEVTTLRKRTEDALEQKWQYEKGLSGIKMDLDRAELETRGLRIILQEHDIFGSSQRTLLDGGPEREDNAADKLQESISMAESERDQARKVADEYRQRAQNVRDGSSSKLLNSAQRMDELANQLDKQVQSNIKLRERLAAVVAKGEREQRESSGKILAMQKRLSTMEDSVLAAQQHSEATLSSYEAEVRRVEEATSPGLKRLTITVPDNKKLAPTSPMMLKSPKLGGRRRSDVSLLEMSKTQMLERKVRELENLLREAEGDIQEVVQRVNQSQLEVAELQTERDAAFHQMHKLQAQIIQEKEKVEELMR